MKPISLSKCMTFHISYIIHHTSYIFLICSFFIGISNKIMAQGCSDAGFCTMGALKPSQKFNKAMNVRLRSVELGQYLGVTKFDDDIFVTNLDFNIGVGKKNSFQLKVPYMYISAPLANTQGLSDITLSFSRNVYFSEKNQINVTIGTKIPIGGVNKTSKDNIVLPMYYQTSLGTYDIVIGGSWLTHGWLVGVGIQHPFNEIDSKFKWGLWKNNEDEQNARRYPVSQALKRGTDGMIRIEKSLRFAKFGFQVGGLAIYRFNKDEILDPATNVRIKVDGTDGFAFTVLASANYNFDTQSALKVGFGRKAFDGISRLRNTDGLSREYVFTLGYEFRF